MSIAVALDQLAATAATYGDAAFVLSTRDDGRPHVSHVRVRIGDGDGVITVPAGRSTRAHAAVRPALVVLWPPHEEGGFSLIVDAQARPTDDRDDLVLEPTNAVLHRPA